MWQVASREGAIQKAVDKVEHPVPINLTIAGEHSRPRLMSALPPIADIGGQGALNCNVLSYQVKTLCGCLDGHLYGKFQQALLD